MPTKSRVEIFEPGRRVHEELSKRRARTAQHQLRRTPAISFSICRKTRCQICESPRISPKNTSSFSESWSIKTISGVATTNTANSQHSGADPGWRTAIQWAVKILGMPAPKSQAASRRDDVPPWEEERNRAATDGKSHLQAIRRFRFAYWSVIAMQDVAFSSPRRMSKKRQHRQYERDCDCDVFRPRRRNIDRQRNG